MRVGEGKGRIREKGKDGKRRGGKGGIREGRSGKGMCRTNVKLLPVPTHLISSAFGDQISYP